MSSSSVDERLFVCLPATGAALCLVIGLFYVFLMPPLQVPDEFAHVFRAYGLSEGYFVAPVATPVPASMQRLMIQFPPHIESVKKLTAGDVLSVLHEPLKPEDKSQTANEGINVNTWIPYVPSAIAIAIARHANASPLGILYFGRLANLVGYTALTWLALHLLPAGRMVLFTLALMPMTLHQAAGLSWDSIVFGIGFVFCALVIRCASASTGPLRPREYIALSVMTLIVSLCKVDFALLPLLLLIPGAKFVSRRMQLGFLAACAAGAFAVNAIWQYADRVNLELFRQHINEQLGANMTGHVAYLFSYPGYFSNALIRTIDLTGYMHLQEFVGTFGWVYVRLPAWAVYLYVFLLLATALTNVADLQMTWMQRTILLFVALLGSLACVLAMWLATPDFYIKDKILHNDGTLFGIQGRHFIPFALPALLLLANRYLRLRLSWVLPAAAILIVLVNIDGLLAIIRAYYA